MQQHLEIDSSTMKPQASANCGWCLTAEATQLLYTVPTCNCCAASTAKERVYKWMRSVHQRNGGHVG